MPFKLPSHWGFEIMLLNWNWRKSGTCWVCGGEKTGPQQERSALVQSSWWNSAAGGLVWPAGGGLLGEGVPLETDEGGHAGRVRGTRRQGNRDRRTWERRLRRGNCQELGICWCHQESGQPFLFHFIFVSVVFPPNHYLLVASLILFLILLFDRVKYWVQDFYHNYPGVHLPWR